MSVFLATGINCFLVPFYLVSHSHTLIKSGPHHSLL